MNELSHPNPELLDAYAREPDAHHHQGISLHIAQCRACRDVVAMNQRLKRQFAQLEHAIPSDDEQAIVDRFVNAPVGMDQHEALQQAIRQNPRMLRSALFSLSQQPESKPQPLKQLDQSALSPVVWWEKLVHWLSAPANRWAPAALTAVVTLVATVAILQSDVFDDSRSSTVHIARFEDEAVLRYRPLKALPGIGFFGDATQSLAPYQGMQIAIDRDQYLRFAWQPVANAQRYEFKLYRFDANGRQLIHNETLDNTQTGHAMTTADFNHRLQWVLSGTTSDDRRFVTRGQLVLDQSSRQQD